MPGRVSMSRYDVYFILSRHGHRDRFFTVAHLILGGRRRRCWLEMSPRPPVYADRRY